MIITDDFLALTTVLAGLVSCCLYKITELLTMMLKLLQFYIRFRCVFMTQFAVMLKLLQFYIRFRCVFMTWFAVSSGQRIIQKNCIFLCYTANGRSFSKVNIQVVYR